MGLSSLKRIRRGLQLLACGTFIFILLFPIHSSSYSLHGMLRETREYSRIIVQGKEKEKIPTQAYRGG